MVQADRPARAPRRRRAGARLALGAGALLVAVLLAEVAARLVVPADRFMSPEVVAQSAAWADSQQTYAVDDELGFAPVLGSRDYDRFGICDWSLAPGERVPGAARFLFLGDSVTRRGTIVGALPAFAEPQSVQLLNAGVESWNPEQEVAFYFRHQRELLSDHVVLSLHNNDLTATSLCLRHEGRYVLCSPGSRVTLNPALYRASMLYRMVVHSRFVHGANPANYLARADAVEAALQRLRDDVSARGGRLTVLVLPILAAAAQRSEHERRSRRRQLEILQRLEIAFVDLQPACDELLAAGIAVRADPADPWHPSGPCGGVLAEAAAAALFDPSPFAATATPRVAGDGQLVELAFGVAHSRRAFRIQSSATLPLWHDTEVAGAFDEDGRARFELAAPPGVGPGEVVFYRAVIGADAVLAATRPWPMILARP